ncbi:MAG: TIGR02757 family protein [Bacteroidetes bacterium]|nr:TIGR02757 family protein [Bacteroidota bacterium]
MKPLSPLQLKEFLEEKVLQFNTSSFIADDPISIPHLFHLKEDKEIAGFLTALIAWGQRKVILKNAQEMMRRMDQQPYNFICDHTLKERKSFSDFVHRTFNGIDAMYMLKALQTLYNSSSSLEDVFSKGIQQKLDLSIAIHQARTELLSFAAPGRTGKHIADPLRNSSAKRICMYLRWMVRNDKTGVDFGIWKKIKPKDLYCPLDIHSGRVARTLGLLTRKQDDWKAVTELTINLKKLDKNDPVKYDFALFGLGVYEGFR